MDSRRNLNAKMRCNLNLAPFQVTYFNNGQYNSDSSYVNRTYFPKTPGGDSSYLSQKNFRTSYNFNHNLNGRYELEDHGKRKAPRLRNPRLDGRRQRRGKQQHQQQLRAEAYHDQKPGEPQPPQRLPRRNRLVLF